jgi:hypothetical protein
VKKPKPKHLVIIFASALIISGFYVLIDKTFPYIRKAETPHKFECGQDLRCIPMVYRRTINDDNGNLLAGVNLLVLFSTEDVFAVDNIIHYNITGTVTNPQNIKSLKFIIRSENDNFENFTNRDPLEVEGDARWQQRLIEIDDVSENINYYGDVNIPFEGKLWIQPTIVDKDEIRYVPTQSPMIFTVGTHVDKLEANSIRETQKSNDVILALTWAGLSMSLVIIGGDILLRIYLRESEIDKWFTDGQSEHKIYR